MPLPLTVTLRSGTTVFRDVTAQLRDVKWRITAPGGNASASVTLDRPLLDTGRELEAFATITISDGRNGQVLWQGDLEDPGRAAGGDGESWNLTAMGAAARAEDVTAPYIGIDSSLEPWVRRFETKPNARNDLQDNFDVGYSLTLSVPQGTSSSTLGGTWIGMRYPHLLSSGQNLGTIRAATVAGRTDANQYQALDVDGSTYDFDTLSTTPGSLSANATAHFGTSKFVPSLMFTHDGGPFTTTSSDWVAFGGVAVRSLIRNKSGTIIAANTYTQTYMTAAEIIGDILGGDRVPTWDGPNAVIATPTLQIRQFAFPDPVSTRQLLDELTTLLPDYFWSVTGDNQFTYQVWPSTIRYCIDAHDGFDNPGSTDDLYNACSVRWVDALGITQRVRATSTIDVLDDAGIVREHAIDMGNNAAIDDTQALAVGDAFLAQHGVPGGSATLTVARPVLDRGTGRTVMPWELQPGCLVKVNGADASVATATATARDGATVFRVVAVEFDSTSCTARLELDSPPRTVGAVTKDLSKNRITRRA